MKFKLPLVFLLVSFAASAQYTQIPDINFEKKLIDLSIDSGTPDGKVLTANVKLLNHLDVSNSGISDLTGIESFTALTGLICSSNGLKTLNVSKNTALLYFDCSSNQLTTLDISKNTLLNEFNCSSNQLTTLDVSNNTLLALLQCDSNSLSTLDVSKNAVLEVLWCHSNGLKDLDVSKCTALTQLTCASNGLTTLDISKNTALIDFSCSKNQLTTLDVSKNTALTLLDCSFNGLTTLDVSKNTALTEFSCSKNQLTTLDVSKNKFLIKMYCSWNNLVSLNLQNGANTILTTVGFQNNPTLSCIQVDDAAYSHTNWSDIKDTATSYANVCTSLGTEDLVFGKMSIYPIPTKGELHIDNVSLNKATVIDTSGKSVKSFYFNNASDKNTLNLNGLAKGIYYLFIESGVAHTTEKIIIE